MIVWGSCVATWQRATDWLIPGLDRNVEHGDLVALTQADHIAAAYNRILDAAPDGAAAVLLHDDTELGDGARTAILAALDDADVAGPIGAEGVTSLAWWEGNGKGRVGETRGTIAFAPPGPVDVLDGLLIALGPKATGLRFDTGYPAWHGYDADICSQARAQGLTVVSAPIPAHHHTKGGYGDRQAWEQADRRWRARWT